VDDGSPPSAVQASHPCAIVRAGSAERIERVHQLPGAEMDLRASLGLQRFERGRRGADLVLANLRAGQREEAGQCRVAGEKRGEQQFRYH